MSFGLLSFGLLSFGLLSPHLQQDVQGICQQNSRCSPTMWLQTKVHMRLWQIRWFHQTNDLWLHSQNTSRTFLYSLFCTNYCEMLTFFLDVYASNFGFTYICIKIQNIYQFLYIFLTFYNFAFMGYGQKRHLLGPSIYIE